jgi:hypothetical protein
MPRFADYHRTVIGYHGTRRSTALGIVQGLDWFKPSANDDDWLGHGIYFWEFAPKQAWAWMEQRRKRHAWTEDVAVLASMIRLGNCFDLLDPENLQLLAGFHREFEHLEYQSGRQPRKNYNQAKYLDCAVFEFAYAALKRQRDPVDTCRAVFVASNQRLWSASGVYRHAHSQLCVRNPKCILGTWLVKPVQD